MKNKFSVENFDKIKEFIYRKTGLSIEFGLCYEKLQNHITDDFSDYFFKLRFDDEDGMEFQKLINIVTNNETFFYREKEQFDVFLKHVFPSLSSSASKTKPLRILCAPCSSGEEAFSIVIYMLENSNILKNIDLEIVAIDIDSEIIEKANQLVYTQKSIRHLGDDLLNKYFTQKGYDFFLDQSLKKYVDFKVVNVYDKAQMLDLGKFDVIFSRNMFIYFDEISRKDVASTFYEILNDGGYVLLGNSEQMSRIVSIYKSYKIDDVFVHQK
jgi:chemotaxis protein methyltransferase CheR